MPSSAATEGTPRSESISSVDIHERVANEHIVAVELYDRLMPIVLCLMAFYERYPYAVTQSTPDSFLSFCCDVACSDTPGPAGYAQKTNASVSRDEVDDLRQTVRALALRVSALEEELHKQRVGAPMETASLKPASLVLPAVEVRNSVESVSSSGVAETAPVAQASAQAAPAQSAPAASVLPTFLPGGATLNYMFDGYYEYDFNHPIGRIQYLRAYDVLSNASASIRPMLCSIWIRMSRRAGDMGCGLTCSSGRRPLHCRAIRRTRRDLIFTGTSFRLMELM